MKSPSDALILFLTYGVTGGLILLGIGVGWYIGARQNPDEMDDTSFMSFASRCTFLFWAWVIAALATVLIEIPLLAFFPMFPAGLPYVITKQETEGSWPLIAVGWFIFSGVTSLAMVAKKRVFYFVIYGILCVLLAFNVVGCHQILKMVQCRRMLHFHLYVIFQGLVESKSISSACALHRPNDAVYNENPHRRVASTLKRKCSAAQALDAVNLREDISRC